MSSEIEQKAADLAEEIGGISAESYSNNPAAALEIMAHCLAMPRIEDRATRRRHGQEILAAVGANFYHSYNRPFVMRISTWVGVSQELPQFTRNDYLQMSNEKLIKAYLRARRILFGMKVAGIAAPKSPGAAVKDAGKGAWEGGRDVLKDAVKNKTLPNGSDLRRGTMSGAAKGLPKSPAHALVWVVGWVAYDEVNKDREAMSRELRRRWKEKKLSQDEYERAFGDIMTGVPFMGPDVDEHKKPSEQYQRE
jgi:hypothetical protein